MSTKANVSVSVRKDESIERALKRFKRMCERAGIRKRVRAKRFYEKPSARRRREERKRIRNRRRAEKKKKLRMQKKLARAKKGKDGEGDGKEREEGGFRERRGGFGGGFGGGGFGGGY